MRLEHPAQDGSADLVGGLFQLVQGMLRLQLGDRGGGQVERSQFTHGLGGVVIDFTNQHADVAHDSLLIHSLGPYYHTPT